MENYDSSKNPHRYEITLRAIGQAMEALSIDAFELLLDGENFVVYGGTESPPSGEKPSVRRFRLFQRSQKQAKRRGFYISGMRFGEADVARLDRDGRNTRTDAERCPDTNSLAHGLRMIGAHIDKTGLNVIGIVRSQGAFTLWHKSRAGAEVKQIFNHANLYDLWVHLYKKRADARSRRTGTAA
jgi:hypothetical protein